MHILARLKREIFIWKWMLRGYTRKVAAIWYNRTNRDFKKYSEKYSKKEIKDIHDKGYRVRCLNRYGIDDITKCDLISDLDYLSISPLNNDFSKWMDDIITTNKILDGYNKYSKDVYYEICRRNGITLFYKFNSECKERISGEQVLDTIREKGIVEVRSAYWLSKRPRHIIECKNGYFYIDGINYKKENLIKKLREITYNAVIVKPDNISMTLENNNYRHYVKCYVSNSPNSKNGSVLFACINIIDDYYSNEGGKKCKRTKRRVCEIDLERGTYIFKDKTYVIDNFQEIRKTIEEMSTRLKTILFYSVSLSLNADNKPFEILSISANPYLPPIAFYGKLNDFLLDCKDKKATKLGMKYHLVAIRKSKFRRHVERRGRPGIRPYMQKLWYRALWDDLTKYRGTSLKEKIWCWKRGFLSYRLSQYGLTEDNYKDFMTDYDYNWLNRINTSYLIWINDKTSFKLFLKNYDEYVPEYYFLIMKKNNELEILDFNNEQNGYLAKIDDIYEVLVREKKLAMKPSSGTHGDGFYCLEYRDGNVYVNDELSSKESLEELICSFRSYYIITEFIDMNSELKKIYPTSVNTVRIMVINSMGHNPKIMQSYIRIGSSKTGFTDNVGYGGICAMIDKESGKIYKPERIIDHKFHECPVHPDTGAPIEIYLPNWKAMCDSVLKVSRSMPELEYLGFDIAFTEDSFKILEINIHQDLHKYADLDEEVKTFFRKKINNKRVINGIK